MDSLSFPVFGLTWYGTQSAGGGIGSNDSKSNNAGLNVIAYCGGGGSAKTGVGNKIVVNVTSDPPIDSALADGATTSRSVEISTGEALCFGVHVFRPYDDTWGMVRLLACVGDEILLYGIPIFENASNGDMNFSKLGDAGNSGEDRSEAHSIDKGGDAIVLGKTHVGNGYGANVATYAPFYRQGKLLHSVAVGCENGVVIVYHLSHDGSDNDDDQSR